MDANLEKDGSLYGGLFLTIMSDLRGSTPVWEDFTTKATKLHTSLKGTLIAITAFLDAFQKVADMATGSRGATKEIGSALTRLCMRHKAIETKLKKFTGTILDSLVTPLQECMEDWKKSVVQLDKDRAKEYKRAKQEIKKCAADTVRLQKKVKKGKVDMQNKLEIAMQDVNDKYILLEEQEKNSLRTALIEERGRFCHFVTCMKPFVDEEVSLLTEVTHLQEIMQNLCLQVDNPESLPASSEQVIHDLKGEGGTWTFQKRVPKIVLGVKTPPSSPSSLGSRKSSMCSISSIASSSSGSAQSHSPCHNKNIQQIQQNTLELQAAIKELEASTAALEGSYQDDTQASQSSLQCSSGYGTMDSTPAGSKDTIASGGIPISAQGGAPGVLSRRSSMNTPKPPPPVRRSSSITSAPNSAVLQKYRASPPRQLGNQAPPGNQQVQSNFQYNNAQQNQSNHRRSLSASGSSEPAYAELTEIQQSIHARHQQQQQSAPATPQYALPVTNPGHLAGSTSVVNSLNAKFANRNSQQVPGMVNVQHSAKGSVYQTNSGPGDDFADLPPPPTADELEEIEKIYSVPKQTQQQQQQYPTQTQNNVQLRHPVQNPNPMGMGGNLRQSLLSEMKAGNRFRKASTDDSSEC